MKKMTECVSQICKKKIVRKKLHLPSFINPLTLYYITFPREFFSLLLRVKKVEAEVETETLFSFGW